MSDDRSVHTDALATLGTIITDAEKRDAIHIAVEPTIAKQSLKPGQHVGVDGTTKNPVGIVDPFLSRDVKAGERFWLLVYPRQITSLRHVWEHPGFPAAQLESSDAKSFSERWMRRWAMKHVSEDYYGDEGRVSEEKAYAFAIMAGHEHTVGPYESAREHIDNEWWDHWEAITGQRGERDEYFSCGC